MKLFCWFFMSCFTLSGYSQSNQNEENRYFSDFVASAIFETTTTSKGIYGGGGGIQYKIGNNWYFNPKSKQKLMIRLTWIRLGIFGGDGSGIMFSPAHVGFGGRLNISDKFSIDPMVSGGLLLGLDDILYPELIWDYAIYPEIKFNINDFVIGAEYTFQRNYTYYNNVYKGSYHYIGLTLGKKFGSNIKK